jgi:hypothetical protein
MHDIKIILEQNYFHYALIIFCVCFCMHDIKIILEQNYFHYALIIFCVCFRTQDTGRYKCIAENNAGKATIEITLTVLGK